MENQATENITLIAMNIILKAGDARVSIKRALDAVKINEFMNAMDALNEAKKSIKEAHQLQTDLIQGEARGEQIDVSVLFSHAQDTLMTIYSEYNLSVHIVEMMKNIDERLRQLEERNNE